MNNSSYPETRLLPCPDAPCPNPSIEKHIDTSTKGPNSCLKHSACWDSHRPSKDSVSFHPWLDSYRYDSASADMSTSASCRLRRSWDTVNVRFESVRAWFRVLLQPLHRIQRNQHTKTRMVSGTTAAGYIQTLLRTIIFPSVSKSKKPVSRSDYSEPALDHIAEKQIEAT